MYKIWIGNRESEILTYNIFDESITYFGSAQNENHAFARTIRTPAKYSNEFKAFVIQTIDNIITLHKDAEFHFYNPMFAHRIINIRPDLAPFFANINDYELLKWITSKTFVREWLSNSVDVPPYALLSKDECINNLHSLFSNYNEFIIQKDISGGGEGTYLLTPTSEHRVYDSLCSNSLYLVSPYLSPKISACCHMLIDNNTTTIFPFGIQTSEIINDKMIYKGTSYSNAIMFNKDAIESLNKKAFIVGERLRNIGYRGICGLDFIVTENAVYFIEINARYLGSSFLINKALKEQNKMSLFEMNHICFNSELPTGVVDGLKINYTSKSEKSVSAMNRKKILEIIDNKNIGCSVVFFDGLENSETVKENTYLYREMLIT